MTHSKGLHGREFNHTTISKVWTGLGGPIRADEALGSPKEAGSGNVQQSPIRAGVVNEGPHPAKLWPQRNTNPCWDSGRNASRRQGMGSKYSGLSLLPCQDPCWSNSTKTWSPGEAVCFELLPLGTRGSPENTGGQTKQPTCSTRDPHMMAKPISAALWPPLSLPAD